MGFGNSKIKVFGDFELTKEQKKDLKAAFRARADASGFVHRQFWVEMAVEKGIVQEFAEIVFNSFDNGEGKMGVESYLGMLAVATSGTEAQRINASFDLFDQDKNGSIDRAELQKVLECCHLYTISKNSTDKPSLSAEDKADIEQMVDVILEEMGLTKEGKISREEFVEKVPKNSDLTALLIRF